MFLTTKELDNRIRTAQITGAYLFYGEEVYLKRHYLDKIRKICCPDASLEAFNHVVVHGGDLDAFLRELSAPALFGGVRLVELRDTDFSKIKSGALSALCDALAGVDDITAIIDTLPDELPAGTPKKPSAVLNALAKSASAVEFARQTPQRLAAWAGRHFAAEGIAANAEVCRMLVDTCLPDMYTLSGEIAKLTAYLKASGQNTLTPQVIREVASPNKIFGAFDFANAILAGDSAGALAAFADMKSRKEKPENILGTLSRITGEMLAVRALSDAGMSRAEIGAALKISDYPLGLRLSAARKSTPERLKAAADACFEADLKLKSTSLPGYALIERLILAQTAGPGRAEGRHG